MYISGNSSGKAAATLKQRRKGPQTIKILKMVALGVLVVGIGAVPPPWMIPRIIRELSGKDSPKDRQHARRRLYELRRQGYIRSNDDTYELTERGKSTMKETELWDLSIPTPKQWSGTWHLVVFDIPRKKSRVRITFIRHLQSLGLQFYQLSVWIYPHPMRDTILKIARHYGLTPYISFITATDIDGADSLKRKFNLT